MPIVWQAISTAPWNNAAGQEYVIGIFKILLAADQHCAISSSSHRIRNLIDRWIFFREVVLIRPGSYYIVVHGAI